MSENPDFFRTVYAEGDDAEFDTERFLLAVESQFQSADVHEEVRWRLNVLRELSADPGSEEAGSGLRKALSRIFATSTAEEEILSSLKDLTEVEGGADGKAVDLRRFMKRERRTFEEGDYRKVLLKKIENTRSQVQNLMIFFPDAVDELTELSASLVELVQDLKMEADEIQAIRAKEEALRESPEFANYESLKQAFLKQWLGRFTGMSDEEIENLAPEEAQRLIVEHQRHQMTQLLKSEVKLTSIDMGEHLNVHDTLEGEFTDEAFWTGANVSARKGFRDWVLGAVQAFGMLKGQRYALFENTKDADQMLLLGIGVAEISEVEGELVKMVPFAKPFTRKSGYLLEIRNRGLGDSAEYYVELRHYVLPFLFAFDSMKEFKLNGDLLSFFTSQY